jgi:hypothetical protein
VSTASVALEVRGEAQLVEHAVGIGLRTSIGNIIWPRDLIFPARGDHVGAVDIQRGGAARRAHCSERRAVVKRGRAAV